jgi:wyosine [tRNA(Phe)-imidazoG37] synthetase (radical SAM superfamily)
MPIHHELAIQCLIYDSYRKDFTSNNNNENVSKLAEALKQIKPNSVQIYSIARIPANYFVFSIDNDRKKHIVDELKKELNDKDIQIQAY